MDLAQAILLGIVEGLTEFLPLSSTFHLIWTSRLLGLPQTEFQKLFEVVIQSGAILAVLALYAQALLRDRALLVRVAASFVPTAAVGFVLFRPIKDVFFESAALQLAVFALVGALFIAAEQAWRGRALERRAEEIGILEAVAIGVAQSVAVVPGVSRAGAVMLAMMALGVRRDESARYSFLIALPTVGAASAFDLYQSRDSIGVAPDGALLLVAGFGVALVAALFVVRWFVRFLQAHSLASFGVYRIALALALAGGLAGGR